MAKNTTADTAPKVTPPAEHLRDAPDKKVRLETGQMKSSYCNVCNASTTRDEVVINFGLNQNWDRGEEDYLIDIQHRVILSPLAAARLRDVLTSLLSEYEDRHGPLKE